MKLPCLILDFDNTITAGESLVELARIALADEPEGYRRIEHIEKITREGMEGNIPFDESLSKRIEILKANKNHLKDLINLLKHRIDQSFLNQAGFWERMKENVFIISSGFKSVITVVLEDTPISPAHIFGNEFIFDQDGWITGVDKSNPLAGAKGKVIVLDSLRLTGKVIAIGDGISDAELKISGQADLFFAFTGHVRRKSILPFADKEIQSFEELKKELEPKS